MAEYLSCVGLALLPPPIANWIRRRRGASIHPTAHIRFGALVAYRHLYVEKEAEIGRFCLVHGEDVHIGRGATVKSLSVVRARRITLAQGAEVAPLSIVFGPVDGDLSSFSLGSLSKVFPFCWIEPGQGVTIGSRSGVGGHNLIFTHGSWANYFAGAPVAFGPVHIGDDVWLPWRVFIMPNVSIGDRAIIGAGSVVTKDIPTESLSAGIPAREVRAVAYATLSQADRVLRADEAIASFRHAFPQYADCDVQIQTCGDKTTPACPRIVFDTPCDVSARLPTIDVVHQKSWNTAGDPLAVSLLSHLTRYGVRIFEDEPV